ncbi:MAG: IS4 family transposase, partial [SAR324 cluster bacterium]|nr:IS4 family transposase [SAR324 cluster bacterium]
MLITTVAPWIEQEFATLKFNDERLNIRAMTILSDQYSSPQATLYGSSADEANAKGVYRFQSNPKVSEDELLKSHREASVKRAGAYSVVLGVHDTTQLDFSTQSQKHGTGPLQTLKQRGFLLHPVVLFTPEKIPLGTVFVKLLSRDDETFGKSKQRAQRPIEEKESYRWIESVQQLATLQKELPHTELVSVSDAESDIYELFLEAQTTAQGPTVLVRAAHNRKLDQEVQKLWPYMEQTAPGFEIELEIPRKDHHPGRYAQAQVSYAQITLPKPANKTGVPVKL